MTRNTLYSALLLCGVVAAAGARELDPTLAVPAATGPVVLDGASLWRIRTVWETPDFVFPDGRIESGDLQVKGNRLALFQKNPDARYLPDDLVSVKAPPALLRMPNDSPADWMKPSFDDGDWARLRVPVLKGTQDDGWKLILMRGAFQVPDPAKAGTLTLSLLYRGGVVVYLNGKELVRTNMPKENTTLYAPAEPYPAEAYFDSTGYALPGYRTPKEDRPHLSAHDRLLPAFKIPADKLVPGVNTIAIEIHRAPTLTRWAVSREKSGPGAGTLHGDCLWAKVGLFDVLLSAEPGSTIPSGKGPVPGRGFKLWNQSVVQRVVLSDYPECAANLNPIRLLGARGGLFAGSVIVGDEKPIQALAVTVSDLSGPGTIPASAVQVRYALPDVSSTGGTLFDSLEEVAPATVPVYKEHGGAIQPLWIRVKVPADAKPGDYTGSVKVAAEGVAPVTVPLQIRVIDWRVPTPDKTVAHMDLVESPESLAMAYGVPMWSDAHLKLLDKTFALLAELSSKTLFITCIRRTHFGNEQAVVRWTLSDECELAPDFSVAEKYLDVARKHLGPIPCVILYTWEPPYSQGHAHAGGDADKPILITIVDKETGKLTAQTGPAWGTAESREFWKKLSDGMQEVLKKRGMERSMLFGLVGDSRPTKLAMDDIGNAVTAPRWAVQSHFFCENWYGYPMRIGSAIWGIGVAPVDPEEGYAYGWSNPMWLNYFPRETKHWSPPVEHRVKVELWMGAKASGVASGVPGYGVCGVGRVGADFWPVMKDDRGRVRGSIAGRYPESAWGQLSLQNTTQAILGRGTNGPIATIRSEAYREGLQEVEARIFVEKALLDSDAKAILGDELLQRARSVLDERIRICNRATESFYISSGWMKRSETLFQLAGEVARKYNGREPNPNLKPPAAPKR
jgi:hypothetical protein